MWNHTIKTGFSKHQHPLQHKHCTFNSNIPSKPQVYTTGGCPGVFQVETTTSSTKNLSCHQHYLERSHRPGLESGASDCVSFAVKAVHGACTKEFLFALETPCGQTVFTRPAWWASKQDCDLHARILMQAHRCAREVTIASSQIVQRDNRSVLLCPPEAVCQRRPGPCCFRAVRRRCFGLDASLKAFDICGHPVPRGSRL